MPVRRDSRHDGDLRQEERVATSYDSARGVPARCILGDAPAERGPPSVPSGTMSPLGPSLLSGIDQYLGKETRFASGFSFPRRAGKLETIAHQNGS